MQTVSDMPMAQPSDDFRVVRPFGPSIVQGKMSEELQKVLCDIFEQQRAKEELEQHEDNAWTLAGNNKREFNILAEHLGSNLRMFQECINQGASEIFLANTYGIWECQKDVATPLHIEMVEDNLKHINLVVSIHGVWGNISVAGDFNPPHHHVGQVSGVGYLKLPEDIEEEWLREDHDPSAGMINFWDGRPLSGAIHMFRRKPVVGDIYFFPAWLPHSVHPFRSKGERWSFSFNIDIGNTNLDVNLSDLQKEELKKERQRLIKEYNNGK